MSEGRITVASTAVVVGLLLVAFSAGPAVATPASSQTIPPQTNPNALAADGHASAAQFDYRVTLTNASIGTWRLTNTTLTNVSVRQLRLVDVRTGNDTYTDRTLTNVTVRRLYVQNITLRNVSAHRLVVRNRSVLDVPGANLLNATLDNQSIDRQVLDNYTIGGVAIGQLTVTNLTLANQTLENRLPAGNALPAGSNVSSETGPPDVSISNATIESAVSENATVSGWTVGNRTG